MEIITDIDTFRSVPTVATIGHFDGVHRGHQHLLGMVRDRARALDVASTVVTFEPHTRAVVRPDQPLSLLTPLPEKLALFAALGIDQAAVVPFTPAMVQRDARQFLTWLGRAFPLVELWEGPGFALGHHRTGNMTVLAEIAHEQGFLLEAFPPVAEGAVVVSSTAVREALAAGDIGRATALLGREYRLSGTVVPGAARGRELGFPTANLEPPAYQAIPADGLYATRTTRPRTGACLPSVTSIGVRPTFGPSERLVEVFILDFSDDLYGEELVVDFVAYLRPQITYQGIEPLIAQMHQDVVRARQVLAGGA